MPKAKTEETGSLSKYELAKLKKLYSQGKASYGSIKSLQQGSGYSEKKLNLSCNQKMPTQNSDKQQENLPVYPHLQNILMKFGVLM